jgi:peptidoglycan/xylan/chitin deacetylase (PgdA/CDA1 family)
MATACGALAAQWAPAAAVVVPSAARALRIPTRLPSRRGVLLSFDDGPHPDGTPAVLAALDRIRAPAVFFTSGEQAGRHPDLVREIVAAGHEVALHGFRHETRRQWSRGLLAADLQRALETLAAAAGVVPRLYRPPHGVFSLSGLRLTRALALEPLLWSRWGRDWERGATASTIADCAAAELGAGDVVLLHDADHYSARGSWRATAAALPLIAERLAAAGLEPARVAPGLSSLELTM